MFARIRNWKKLWLGLQTFEKVFWVFMGTLMTVTVGIGMLMAFLLEAVLLGNYDIYMGRHEPLGKVTCPMVDRQVRESLSPGGVWAEVASQATFACERRQITVGPCSPGKLRPDGIEHCLDEKVARALKRNDVLVCESEMVYSYTGYFASDHKRVLVDTCRVK